MDIVYKKIGVASRGNQSEQRRCKSISTLAKECGATGEQEGIWSNGGMQKNERANAREKQKKKTQESGGGGGGNRCVGGGGLFLGGEKKRDRAGDVRCDGGGN